MAVEFTTALGLLRALTNTAKGLVDAPAEVKVNEVSLQLQDILLDLQSEITLIQSDYQYVLRERDKLEKKLYDRENWDRERARYQLEEVGVQRRGFVYVFNAGQSSIEPAHWICAHCYEDKKKSILQADGFGTWHCPRCKAAIVITGGPGENQF